MKTKVLAIIIVIISMIFLYGCFQIESKNEVNNNDWSYELRNDYEIWHINSKKIVCGKRTSEYAITNIIGDYITQFCYDEQYIYLQNIARSDGTEENIEQIAPEFYIINTMNDKVKGPLSESEFEEFFYNLNEKTLPLSWIKTRPRPEGAKFD